MDAGRVEVTQCPLMPALSGVGGCLRRMAGDAHSGAPKPVEQVEHVPLRGVRGIEQPVQLLVRIRALVPNREFGFDCARPRGSAVRQITSRRGKKPGEPGENFIGPASVEIEVCATAQRRGTSICSLRQSNAVADHESAPSGDLRYSTCRPRREWTGLLRPTNHHAPAFGRVPT